MAGEVPFGSGQAGQCGGGGGGCGGACHVAPGGLRVGFSTRPVICLDLTSNTMGCGACLAGDQRIATTEGEKAISELNVGDRILGVTCGLEVTEQSVTALRTARMDCLQIVHERGSIVCSKSHLLLDHELNSIQAVMVEVGSLLLSSDMSPSRVQQIKQVGELDVFDLTCEPDHTYIAEGICHHNKQANPIPYYGIVEVPPTGPNPE